MEGGNVTTDFMSLAFQRHIEHVYIVSNEHMTLVLYPFISGLEKLVIFKIVQLCVFSSVQSLLPNAEHLEMCFSYITCLC